MNQPKKKLKQSFSKSEWQRLQFMTLFEEEAHQKGYSLIAGIDEAGRGPMAGPVVAAACIIPHGLYFSDVNDSKLLTPKKRREIFDEIKSHQDVVYGIGIIDALEIDQINIYQATIKAMLQAIAQLAQQPDYLLVDAVKLPHPCIPVNPIIKGDTKSQSIAAASIIAKETRDDLMQKYHRQWPQYGFDRHKGYGTALHLAAIKEHGRCPIHRQTFKFGDEKNSDE